MRAGDIRAVSAPSRSGLPNAATWNRRRRLAPTRHTGCQVHHHYDELNGMATTVHYGRSRPIGSPSSLSPRSAGAFVILSDIGFSMRAQRFLRRTATRPQDFQFPVDVLCTCRNINISSKSM
jgi:hypothetical protein